MPTLFFESFEGWIFQFGQTGGNFICSNGIDSYWFSVDVTTLPHYKPLLIGMHSLNVLRGICVVCFICCKWQWQKVNMVPYSRIFQSHRSSCKGPSKSCVIWTQEKQSVFSIFLSKDEGATVRSSRWWGNSDFPYDTPCGLAEPKELYTQQQHIVSSCPRCTLCSPILKSHPLWQTIMTSAQSICLLSVPTVCASTHTFLLLF